MRHDLRSDTLTLQSEAMRKAMYEAEVGDDVYGEDPTVGRLEAMAAELTGKEASLFVTSGCMGNLIPIMIYGGRGKEILAAEQSHIIQHEIGAVSAIGNTLPIIVPSENGIIAEEEIVKYIRPKAYDAGETAIIEVENTTSGLIYPLEKLMRIKELAGGHSLKVHMDGARIFNAVVETGIPLTVYAACADSLTFCVSKGLGAPAGSLLCGDKAFIAEARRMRKLLGGGMRQSGFLAAAGIYALNHNINRLKEDNLHALMIKETIEQTSWAKVRSYGTNMLFFETPDYAISEVVAKFNQDGILVLEEKNACRVVTSLNVSEKDTMEVVNYIRAFDPEKL